MAGTFLVMLCRGCEQLEGVSWVGWVDPGWMGMVGPELLGSNLVGWRLGMLVIIMVS